jgi:hypothetical protein
MSGRSKQTKTTAPCVITRPKRSRIDKGECGDGVSCYSCKNDIHVNADHIVLKPCMCIICTRCLSNGHARRGSHALSCPSCNGNVISHRVIIQPASLMKMTRFTQSAPIGEPTADEIKKNFPKNYLEQQEGWKVSKDWKRGNQLQYFMLFG